MSMTTTTKYSPRAKLVALKRTIPSVVDLTDSLQYQYLAAVDVFDTEHKKAAPRRSSNVSRLADGVSADYVLLMRTLLGLSATTDNNTAAAALAAIGRLRSEEHWLRSSLNLWTPLEAATAGFLIESKHHEKDSDNNNNNDNKTFFETAMLSLVRNGSPLTFYERTGARAARGPLHQLLRAGALDTLVKLLSAALEVGRLDDDLEPGVVELLCGPLARNTPANDGLSVRLDVAFEAGAPVVAALQHNHGMQLLQHKALWELLLAAAAAPPEEAKRARRMIAAVLMDVEETHPHGASCIRRRAAAGELSQLLLEHFDKTKKRRVVALNRFLEEALLLQQCATSGDNNNNTVFSNRDAARAFFAEHLKLSSESASVVDFVHPQTGRGVIHTVLSAPSSSNDDNNNDSDKSSLYALQGLLAAAPEQALLSTCPPTAIDKMRKHPRYNAMIKQRQLDRFPVAPTSDTTAPDCTLGETWGPLSGRWTVMEEHCKLPLQQALETRTRSVAEARAGVVLDAMEKLMLLPADQQQQQQHEQKKVGLSDMDKCLALAVERGLAVQLRRRILKLLVAAFVREYKTKDVPKQKQKKNNNNNSNNTDDVVDPLHRELTPFRTITATIVKNDIAFLQELQVFCTSGLVSITKRSFFDRLLDDNSPFLGMARIVQASPSEREKDANGREHAKMTPIIAGRRMMTPVLLAALNRRVDALRFLLSADGGDASPTSACVVEQLEPCERELTALGTDVPQEQHEAVARSAAIVYVSRFLNDCHFVVGDCDSTIPKGQHQERQVLLSDEQLAADTAVFELLAFTYPQQQEALRDAPLSLRLHLLFLFLQSRLFLVAGLTTKIVDALGLSNSSIDVSELDLHCFMNVAENILPQLIRLATAGVLSADSAQWSELPTPLWCFLLLRSVPFSADFPSDDAADKTKSSFRQSFSPKSILCDGKAPMFLHSTTCALKPMAINRAMNIFSPWSWSTTNSAGAQVFKKQLLEPLFATRSSSNNNNTPVLRCNCTHALRGWALRVAAWIDAGSDAVTAPLLNFAFDAHIKSNSSNINSNDTESSSSSSSSRLQVAPMRIASETSAFSCVSEETCIKAIRSFTIEHAAWLVSLAPSDNNNKKESDSNIEKTDAVSACRAFIKQLRSQRVAWHRHILSSVIHNRDSEVRAALINYFTSCWLPKIDGGIDALQQQVSSSSSSPTADVVDAYLLRIAIATAMPRDKLAALLEKKLLVGDELQQQERVANFVELDAKLFPADEKLKHDVLVDRVLPAVSKDMFAAFYCNRADSRFGKLRASSSSSLGGAGAAAAGGVLRLLLSPHRLHHWRSEDKNDYTMKKLNAADDLLNIMASPTAAASTWAQELVVSELDQLFAEHAPRIASDTHPPFAFLWAKRHEDDDADDLLLRPEFWGRLMDVLLHMLCINTNVANSNCNKKKDNLLVSYLIDNCLAENRHQLPHLLQLTVYYALLNTAFYNGDANLIRALATLRRRGQLSYDFFFVHSNSNINSSNDPVKMSREAWKSLFYTCAPRPGRKKEVGYTGFDDGPCGSSSLIDHAISVPEYDADVVRADADGEDVGKPFLFSEPDDPPYSAIAAAVSKHGLPLMLDLLFCSDGTPVHSEIDKLLSSGAHNVDEARPLAERLRVFLHGQQQQQQQQAGQHNKAAPPFTPFPERPDISEEEAALRLWHLLPERGVLAHWLQHIVAHRHAVLQPPSRWDADTAELTPEQQRQEEWQSGEAHCACQPMIATLFPTPQQPSSSRNEQTVTRPTFFSLAMIHRIAASRPFVRRASRLESIMVLVEDFHRRIAEPYFDTHLPMYGSKHNDEVFSLYPYLHPACGQLFQGECGMLLMDALRAATSVSTASGLYAPDPRAIRFIASSYHALNCTWQNWNLAPSAAASDELHSSFELPDWMLNPTCTPQLLTQLMPVAFSRPVSSNSGGGGVADSGSEDSDAPVPLLPMTLRPPLTTEIVQVARNTQICCLDSTERPFQSVRVLNQACYDAINDAYVDEEGEEPSEAEEDEEQADKNKKEQPAAAEVGAPIIHNTWYRFLSERTHFKTKAKSLELEEMVAAGRRTGILDHGDPKNAREQQPACRLFDELVHRNAFMEAQQQLEQQQEQEQQQRQPSPQLSADDVRHLVTTSRWNLQVSHLLQFSISDSVAADERLAQDLAAVLQIVLPSQLEHAIFCDAAAAQIMDAIDKKHKHEHHCHHHHHTTEEEQLLASLASLMEQILFVRAAEVEVQLKSHSSSKVGLAGIRAMSPAAHRSADDSDGSAPNTVWAHISWLSNAGGGGHFLLEVDTAAIHDATAIVTWEPNLELLAARVSAGAELSNMRRLQWQRCRVASKQLAGFFHLVHGDGSNWTHSRTDARDVADSLGPHPRAVLRWRDPACGGKCLVQQIVEFMNEEEPLRPATFLERMSGTLCDDGASVDQIEEEDEEFYDEEEDELDEEPDAELRHKHRFDVALGVRVPSDGWWSYERSRALDASSVSRADYSGWSAMHAIALTRDVITARSFLKHVLSTVDDEDGSDANVNEFPVLRTDREKLQKAGKLRRRGKAAAVATTATATAAAATATATTANTEEEERPFLTVRPSPLHHAVAQGELLLLHLLVDKVCGARIGRRIAGHLSRKAAALSRVLHHGLDPESGNKSVVDLLQEIVGGGSNEAVAAAAADKTTTTTKQYNNETKREARLILKKIALGFYNRKTLKVRSFLHHDV